MDSPYGILAKAFRFYLRAVHVGSLRQTMAGGKRNADFASLPGISQFRTVLANEFRKAFKSQSHLTVVYLDLPNYPPARREEIAMRLLRNMRRNNSLFSLSETALAVILPRMGPVEAAAVMFHVLNLISTDCLDHPYEFNVVAYPNHVATLYELEAAAPVAISGEEEEAPGGGI